MTKQTISNLSEKLFTNDAEYAAIQNKNKLITCINNEDGTVSYTLYDQKTLTELDGGEYENEPETATLAEFLAFLDDEDFNYTATRLSGQLGLFRLSEENAEMLVEDLENLSYERLRILTEYSFASAD